MENKYYRIPHLGSSESEGIFLDEIVVQAKIDGCNMSVYIDNGVLIFRSRNRVLGNKVDEATFKNAAKFITEKFNDNSSLFDPSLIYFFEGMYRHTINYDFENAPSAIGFDVMDKNTGLFFDWKVAKQAFEKIGVPFVPILMTKKGQDVKVEELQQIVNTQKSQFAKDELEEGVVVKNFARLNKFNRPLFAKLTRVEFKEANRLKFSGLKELRDVERSIVTEFCTSARVRKLILKLTLEEGNNLSMSLMPILFKSVSDDILTEAILEIQQKYSSIQFKEFTNMVAARCAKELKIYMAEK